MLTGDRTETAKAVASELGITDVEYRMGAIRLYPARLDMELCSILGAKFSKRFAISAGTKPYLALAGKPKQTPVTLLDEFLSAAEQAASQKLS